METFNRGQIPYERKNNLELRLIGRIQGSDKNCLLLAWIAAGWRKCSCFAGSAECEKSSFSSSVEPYAADDFVKTRVFLQKLTRGEKCVRIPTAVQTVLKSANMSAQSDCIGLHS